MSKVIEQELIEKKKLVISNREKKPRRNNAKSYKDNSSVTDKKRVSNRNSFLLLNIITL